MTSNNVLSSGTWREILTIVADSDSAADAVAPRAQPGVRRAAAINVDLPEPFGPSSPSVSPRMSVAGEVFDEQSLFDFTAACSAMATRSPPRSSISKRTAIVASSADRGAEPRHPLESLATSFCLFAVLAREVARDVVLLTATLRCCCSYCRCCVRRRRLRCSTKAAYPPL